MSNFFAAALVSLVGLVSVQVRAAEIQTFNIVITQDAKTKDVKFVPSEIEAPANAKFKLVVKNDASVAEEFESHELNREKVISPGASATIFLGPLPAGTYPFMGEFHPKTAQGKLILK